MATVLSHKEDHALCQIEGDLTEAYRHTCHKVIRNMCWEPEKGKKGVLTVHDLVEAKSNSFIAAFHLHCQSAPKVRGNVITISNEKAQLVCRVLQPEKPVICAIGGKGQEFIVDGVNYDTPSKENTEAGWGQVIITSETQTAHTEFLVEMELQSKNN